MCTFIFNFFQAANTLMLIIFSSCSQHRLKNACDHIDCQKHLIFFFSPASVKPGSKPHDIEELNDLFKILTQVYISIHDKGLILNPKRTKQKSLHYINLVALQYVKAIFQETLLFFPMFTVVVSNFGKYYTSTFCQILSSEH